MLKKKVHSRFKSGYNIIQENFCFWEQSCNVAIMVMYSALNPCVCRICYDNVLSSADVDQSLSDSLLTAIKVCRTEAGFVSLLTPHPETPIQTFIVCVCSGCSTDNAASAGTLQRARLGWRVPLQNVLSGDFLQILFVENQIFICQTCIWIKPLRLHFVIYLSFCACDHILLFFYWLLMNGKSWTCPLI